MGREGVESHWAAVRHLLGQVPASHEPGAKSSLKSS